MKPYEIEAIPAFPEPGLPPNPLFWLCFWIRELGLQVAVYNEANLPPPGIGTIQVAIPQVLGFGAVHTHGPAAVRVAAPALDIKGKVM